MDKSDLVVSMHKLLTIVGCPYWLRGTSVDSDATGKPILVIRTNTKSVNPSELNAIPLEIDGVGVSIIYRSVPARL